MEQCVNSNSRGNRYAQKYEKLFTKRKKEHYDSPNDYRAYRPGGYIPKSCPEAIGGNMHNRTKKCM